MAAALHSIHQPPVRILPHCGLIGSSSPMVALRDLIGRAARSSAPVMITGASGTGKELVARALHAASRRREGPMVALNCGAIPSELIESELFGHERGAFSGAHCQRTGYFEQADKGTIFLDEIGDMPFSMQVKLLRVLEDGLVTRVGANRTVPVDIRVVSATHRDIHAAIADNRLREDLYFRLGVVVIHVPDLASRITDIPQLIALFQQRKGSGACRFDGTAMRGLMEHAWPGNVRELRNVVERANVLFAGDTIDAATIGTLLAGPTTRLTPLSFPVTAIPALSQPIDLKHQLESFERDGIRAALAGADGVISEAARLLSLKRTTLVEKMRKYGLGAAGLKAV